VSDEDAIMKRQDSNDTAFATRWILLAVLYFVAAVCLGVGMAASHDFRLRGLHVHLNMLGWVSSALTGVVYRLYPRVAALGLARWHFRLYHATLPVMMASLGALLLGHAGAEPVVAASSVLMALSIVLFALAVWRGARATTSALDLQQAQLAPQ
jgi:hypothetical protein